MELFDEKFVHFMWSDELEDKEGFLADIIGLLINRVNNNETEYKGCVVESDNINEPFEKIYSSHSWAFFYYDPAYAIKRAYLEGEKIQYRFTAEDEIKWHNLNEADVLTIKEQGMCWFDDIEDGIEYRIESTEAEEPKSRRMTYRELAEWLAKGNGQCTTGHLAVTQFGYDSIDDEDNKELPVVYKIRRWGSDDWIEPTVDMYNADCKKEN